MATKQEKKFWSEAKQKYVSRSSHFREKRALKKADTSVAGTRKRIVAEVKSPGDVARDAIAVDAKEHRGEYVLVRDAALERERVETFLLVARPQYPGDPNDICVMHLPRKIVQATIIALQGAGY